MNEDRTGFPSARSALNLRLALALFGLVVSAVGAALAIAADLPALAVALAVLALVALVNVGVVERRRRERRRAEQRLGRQGDHGLFE